MAYQSDRPTERYLGFRIDQHAQENLVKGYKTDFWCRTIASQEDGDRYFAFAERITALSRGQDWPSEDEELADLLFRRGKGLARAALALNAIPLDPPHRPYQAVDLSRDGPPHSLEADENALGLLTLAALRNLGVTFRGFEEDRVDVRGIGELLGAHPNLAEDVRDRLLDRGDIQRLGQDEDDNFDRLKITEKGRTRLASTQVALPPNEYGFEISGRPNRQPPVVRTPSASLSQNRVFVVHGRAENEKSEVAHWLRSIGLEPVILHERPNAGRTIIEKFSEEAAGVGYAVVLATGDDEAQLRGQSGNDLELRPRPNVVLELGFFLGKLGRDKVAVLRAPGVELPSDYHGVLYIELDSAGMWKNELARELKTAGLSVDDSKP